MRTLILLMAAATAGFAQEAPVAQAAAGYKVEFTIRDGADATRAARRYTMYLEGTGRGSFRLGYRVPYATGYQPSVGTTGVAPMVATQWNYLDAGMNIDARIRP